MTMHTAETLNISSFLGGLIIRVQNQRVYSVIYRRAGQNVNTPLRTLFLQISQAIEVHLQTL